VVTEAWALEWKGRRGDMCLNMQVRGAGVGGG